MLNIVGTREKKLADGRSFRIAVLSGHGDNDHASWWSFDDEDEVRARHWHMKPGDVVLDIGAAFGSYALPALAQGAGRVYAFNPADFDAALMTENLRLNPEFGGRCTMVREGIGGRDCYFNPRLSVFSDDEQQVRGGGNVAGADDWIRVRSLDSWVAERGLERIDWIKMDIEGAELEAVRGAEKTLRRCRPKLLIENHLFHDGALADKVRNFLVGLDIGYVCDGPYPYHAISHSYFEVR